MTLPEIRTLRLRNQQITTTTCEQPADVVKHVVAMQAQEFRHAKWAIGLRLQDATERIVDKAFNDGAILRTHLMRPTWHFVAPADIRWLLALTAPRVHAGNEPYYRKFELSPALFTRCHKIITRSLEGGKNLKRTDLQAALKQNKILADGPRLAYIMMHAELEGLICSGPRLGKLFTYSLLEERVPQAKTLERDEALATFLMRYFNSRGPATLHDFTYWSGLTLKDARTGIGAVKSQLQNFVVGGKEYFLGDFTPPPIETDGRDTFLMPDYDEYGMSYKDRSALLTVLKGKKSNSNTWSVFGHNVVIEGTIQGTWKDEVIKDSLVISSKLMQPLSRMASKKLKGALTRYASFFEKKLLQSR